MQHHHTINAIPGSQECSSSIGNSCKVWQMSCVCRPVRHGAWDMSLGGNRLLLFVLETTMDSPADVQSQPDNSLLLLPLLLLLPGGAAQAEPGQVHRQLLQGC
jgi:hypothetical protein